MGGTVEVVGGAAEVVGGTGGGGLGGLKGTQVCPSMAR